MEPWLIIILVLIVVVFALIVGLLVFLLSNQAEEVQLAPREEHLVAKLAQAGIIDFNRGLLQFEHRGRMFNLVTWGGGGDPLVHFRTRVKKPSSVTLAAQGKEGMSPRLTPEVIQKPRLDVGDIVLSRKFYIGGSSADIAEQVLMDDEYVRDTLLILRDELPEIWFSIDTDYLTVSPGVPSYSERDLTASQLLLCVELASRLADAVERLTVRQVGTASSLRGQRVGT